MSAGVIDAVGSKRRRGVFSFLRHEFLAVVPPTLFFFVGFNLILFTKRLFVAEYLIQYAGFLIATTGALIVGKVVLVTDKMPFLRRFDDAPLAYPILFKSFVYALFVSVARLIEALVHYLVAGGVLGGGHFIEHLIGNFSWAHFLAACSWRATDGVLSSLFWASLAWPG